MEALSNPDDINSPQNAVVRNERSLWPNARVPYVLDGSLSNSAQRAIQDAVNEYATRTCVRFVPRTNERDYVRFYRGSGCVDNSNSYFNNSQSKFYVHFALKFIKMAS